MTQSLHSIITIFVLLVLGYFVGRVIKPSIRELLVTKIPITVLLLLFMMGIELGGVFTNSEVGLAVIGRAFLLSLTIAIVTVILLFKRREIGKPSRKNNDALHSFLGCFKAITAFSLGLVIYNITGFQSGGFFISSSLILYIILFLVGLDLVGFPLGQLTPDLIKLPLLTLIATVCGALLFALFSDLTWRETLLSASGFGWFSLSGPMVAALVSSKMGGLAFMTDFFREIFSILFLYFCGKEQPRAAISISGAAALDSALPFIKENCEANYIKYALVSGFILTLLGPFFIVLAITFFYPVVT